MIFFTLQIEFGFKSFWENSLTDNDMSGEVFAKVGAQSIIIKLILSTTIQKLENRSKFEIFNSIVNRENICLGENVQVIQQDFDLQGRHDDK